MADPISALLVGTAATAAEGTAAATAATAGLFGAGGALSFGTTAATLGTLGGIVGSVGSGLSQAQNAQYQSQIAANNQTIAQQNAQEALQQGQSQEQTQEQKTAAVIGSQVVGQAAGNIDVNSGSALDVRSSAAALGELSALNIGYNAQTKANAFLNQANVAGAQSSMYQAQELPDIASGFLNPNSSVIGSATGAAKYLYANL